MYIDYSVLVFYCCMTNYTKNYECKTKQNKKRLLTHTDFDGEEPRTGLAELSHYDSESLICYSKDTSQGQNHLRSQSENPLSSSLAAGRPQVFTVSKRLQFLAIEAFP